MNLDDTDLLILASLRKNSRQQWKELGRQVHLTGQAVADRVKRLEDSGILKRYTVDINERGLGNEIHAIIHVFMHRDRHSAFQALLQAHDCIRSAHRISGHGCYILDAVLPNNEELNRLLDALLPYGNYQLNLSIQQIK